MDGRMKLIDWLLNLLDSAERRLPEWLIKCIATALGLGLVFTLLAPLRGHVRFPPLMSQMLAYFLEEVISWFLALCLLHGLKTLIKRRKR